VIEMKTRTLGKTGRQVSAVGLGTWQLGSDWGQVQAGQARDVLEAAVDAGITFFDTADVYGDGRSEQLIGAFLASHPGLDITVGTKMGRRAEQVPENYTLANFRQWLDRSRRNLKVDILDLVQLHCPPAPVYTDDAVYDSLDALVDEGIIRHYGVSVETAEQALTAMQRDNVATVQIIFNPFRLKPLEDVLPAAKRAGIGIIARVPLASGLLTGKYSKETFSGVDFEQGLSAVRDFEQLVPRGVTTAQAALAWITQQDGISTVIPGARNVEQVLSNAAAGSVEELGEEFTGDIWRIYDKYFRESVHAQW
jgi:aryl-alcohol dehydrogenase-like predicted oxidoreductase